MKSDHDLLITLVESVSTFHKQYAADEVRKDGLRREAQARQQVECDEQRKWISKVQRDVDTLKNWRTGIIGGVTSIMAYLKLKGIL